MSDEQEQVDRQPAHQPDETSVRGVTFFTVALLVTLGLALLAVWGYFRLLGARSRSAETIGAKLPAGAERVEPWVRQRQELERYRRQQAALLQGYRWIDRQQGLVALPIERAMVIVVEQGYPPAGGAR